MTHLSPAYLLAPGQAILDPEGRVRVIAAVNVLSHRVSIQDTDGKWLVRFPDARVPLADLNRFGYAKCPSCGTAPATIVIRRKGVSDPWDDHANCSACGHSYASGTAVFA